MTKYRRNKARVFVKDVRRYGEYLRLGLPRVVVIFWKNNPKRIAITKQQTEDAKNYLRWLTFQSKSRKSKYCQTATMQCSDIFKKELNMRIMILRLFEQCKQNCKNCKLSELNQYSRNKILRDTYQKYIRENVSFSKINITDHMFLTRYNAFCNQH